MDLSLLNSLAGILKNPAENHNAPPIPQDVLNSYPSSFIDSPSQNKVCAQENIGQNANLQNNTNFQGQNLLGALLPYLTKSNPALSNLQSIFGGGNMDITKILSMLGGLGKSQTKQKNSHIKREFKKVEDYNFDN